MTLTSSGNAIARKPSDPRWRASLISGGSSRGMTLLGPGFADDGSRDESPAGASGKAWRYGATEFAARFSGVTIEAEEGSLAVIILNSCLAAGELFNALIAQIRRD